MKINKRYTFIFIYAFIIGFVFFIYIYNLNYQRNEICQGTIVYKLHLKNKSYTYKLTHRIFISDSKVGYDSVRGVLVVDDMTYLINRSISFTHREVMSGRIEFVPTFINKSVEDTLSDKLFDEYFPFMTMGSRNYFRLDALGNEKKLISGNNGRFLICSTTF